MSFTDDRPYSEIGLIVSKFHKIVSLLREESFIRTNVSQYDFYTIRIASRRGIHLRRPREGEELRGLKNGKTKCRFEEHIKLELQNKCYSRLRDLKQRIRGMLTRSSGTYIGCSKLNRNCSAQRLFNLVKFWTFAYRNLQ